MSAESRPAPATTVTLGTAVEMKVGEQSVAKTMRLYLPGGPNVPPEERGAQAPPPAEPPAPEFADVQAAVEELRGTVTTVITTDEAQSQTVISALARLFPALVPFVAPHVTGAASTLRETVEASVAELERLVAERLAPHAECPARLEAERDAGRKQGDAIVALAEKARDLATSEEWQGEAAEGYRRAALVQANALTELGGVELSSANAVDRAAMLNRAAFFIAAEAIRFTVQQLDVTPSGDGAELFQRTRAADAHLRVLIAKLGTELDAIGVGETVAVLASDLTELLEAPAVLEPTAWPTGGAAADTPPAPTAEVIPAT